MFFFLKVINFNIQIGKNQQCCCIFMITIKFNEYAMKVIIACLSSAMTSNSLRRIVC